VKVERGDLIVADVEGETLVAVVVQSATLQALDRLVVVPVTTDAADDQQLMPFRLGLSRGRGRNKKWVHVMIDNPLTIERKHIQEVVASLTNEQMRHVDFGLVTLLGLDYLLKPKRRQDRQP
jgi:mRNA-degrading endonuclease toxin of MazEF toxin-antitoxin module